MMERHGAISRARLGLNPAAHSRLLIYSVYRSIDMSAYDHDTHQLARPSGATMSSAWIVMRMQRRRDSVLVLVVSFLGYGDRTVATLSIGL